MPDADERIALFLATAAAIGILHRRAHHSVETVNEQLEQALTSRVVIERAKGVLAERHDLKLEAAFDRLRHHARTREDLFGGLGPDEGMGPVVPSGEEGAMACWLADDSLNLCGHTLLHATGRRELFE